MHKSECACITRSKTRLNLNQEVDKLRKGVPTLLYLYNLKLCMYKKVNCYGIGSFIDERRIICLQLKTKYV